MLGTNLLILDPSVAIFVEQVEVDVALLAADSVEGLDRKRDEAKRKIARPAGAWARTFGLGSGRLGSRVLGGGSLAFGHAGQRCTWHASSASTQGFLRVRMLGICCLTLKNPSHGSVLSDCRRAGTLATVKASEWTLADNSSQASGQETGAPGLARVA